MDRGMLSRHCSERCRCAATASHRAGSPCATTSRRVLPAHSVHATCTVTRRLLRRPQTNVANRQEPTIHVCGESGCHPGSPGHLGEQRRHRTHRCLSDFFMVAFLDQLDSEDCRKTRHPVHWRATSGMQRKLSSTQYNGHLSHGRGDRIEI